MILIMIVGVDPVLAENEVLKDTLTEIVVRQHPKTGDSFISIIPVDKPRRKDLQFEGMKTYSRPDYRMLQAGVKSGQIPYDGPYSSSKKIYILAASLATMGVAGSVIGAAAFPAAATTASAGGGAGLAVGAGAVAVTGAVATTAYVKSQHQISDDYARSEVSSLLESDTDFYYIHIQPELREEFRL